KVSAPQTGAWVPFMVTHDTTGRAQEMFCVAFPDFLIWLATITPSRVKEEARAALIRTRAEIKQVIANHYRERLLGEAVAVEQATQAFETEWAGAKSWRPAILMGCRNGWSFARIRAAARPSTPQWRIAEDIRNAHRLGLIDWMPQDTPAPRVAPQPTPETDPRQISMFAEG
ncbi:phage antirepressor N-terminal domain-containing protein, partial [uncultured Roseovarius sp.]|uniref:phage antirepressor N-terminal domain-containing protein n=1 Tax=uncultured Roseovarius sp. TaxID=293344 RepID=UPI00261DBBAF